MSVASDYVIFLKFIYWRNLFYHWQPNPEIFKSVSLLYTIQYKRGRPQVFCKKGVLKKVSYFSGKSLCRRPGLQLYQKRDSDAGVFLWILRNFLEYLIYRAPLVATSSRTKIWRNVRLQGVCSTVLKTDIFWGCFDRLTLK